MNEPIPARNHPRIDVTCIEAGLCCHLERDPRSRGELDRCDVTIFQLGLNNEPYAEWNPRLRRWRCYFRGTLTPRGWRNLEAGDFAIIPRPPTDAQLRPMIQGIFRILEWDVPTQLEGNPKTFDIPNKSDRKPAIPEYRQPHPDRPSLLEQHSLDIPQIDIDEPDLSLVARVRMLIHMDTPGQGEHPWCMLHAYSVVQGDNGYRSVPRDPEDNRFLLYAIGCIYPDGWIWAGKGDMPGEHYGPDSGWVDRFVELADRTRRYLAWPALADQSHDKQFMRDL